MSSNTTILWSLASQFKVHISRQFGVSKNYNRKWNGWVQSKQKYVQVRLAYYGPRKGITFYFGIFFCKKSSKLKCCGIESFKDYIVSLGEEYYDIPDTCCFNKIFCTPKIETDAEAGDVYNLIYTEVTRWF